MSSSVRGGCVLMCQEFHTGTRDLSMRFLNELKRHNYVTPTSYLELINTFKVLLQKKQGYVPQIFFITKARSIIPYFMQKYPELFWSDVSYIKGIFKSCVGIKIYKIFREVTQAKNRYEVGLQKLKTAASEVC